jgi:hypothetical protein
MVDALSSSSFWSNSTNWDLSSATSQLRQNSQYQKMDIGQMLKAGAFDNSSDMVKGLAGLAVFQQQIYDSMDKSIDISAQDAQAYKANLDGNKDGVLSEDELKSGIDNIQKTLTGLQSQPQGITQQEAIMEMSRQSQFAANLLFNFDSIAGQDGQDGISNQDINKLAGQQGAGNRITGLDFYKLSDPQGYQNYQAMSMLYDGVA